MQHQMNQVFSLFFVDSANLLKLNDTTFVHICNNTNGRRRKVALKEKDS